MQLGNWLSSYHKWVEIVRRTRLKRKWSDRIGWATLTVGEKCGYCEWYLVGSRAPCQDCPMRHICDCKKVRAKEGYPFWALLRNMRSDRVNWKLAIEQSETILNAIIEHGKELGYYPVKVAD